MFLKTKETGDLIEIKDIEELCDPFRAEVVGINQSGENEQTEENHLKSNLTFPSDESLPACWCDPDYKPVDVPHRSATANSARDDQQA
jgi:hypothetical protein